MFIPLLYYSNLLHCLSKRVHIFIPQKDQSVLHNLYLLFYSLLFHFNFSHINRLREAEFTPAFSPPIQQLMDAKETSKHNIELYFLSPNRTINLLFPLKSIALKCHSREYVTITHILHLFHGTQNNRETYQLWSEELILFSSTYLL